jgi:hypothetical protein
MEESRGDLSCRRGIKMELQGSLKVEVGESVFLMTGTGGRLE